jgi:predicted Zn-dependent protease
MTTEHFYKSTLETEPGNPAFADYAARLVAEERLHDAIIVCLQGLSANPELSRGRLIFAHALFRAGYVPFAAREVLMLLENFPTNPHLASLLDKLAPGSAAAITGSEQSTEGDAAIADVEFDIDVLEGLEKKR